MLGIRRAPVSGIAADLQEDGIIRYSRDAMTILDRPALEERSCACYRDEYTRLLSPLLLHTARDSSPKPRTLGILGGFRAAGR